MREPSRSAGGPRTAALAALVAAGCLCGWGVVGGGGRTGAADGSGRVPLATYREADWNQGGGRVRCPGGYSNGASPGFHAVEPGRPVGDRTPEEALEAHESFLLGHLGGPGATGALAIASKQVRPSADRYEVLYLRADGLAVASVEATRHGDGSWLFEGSSYC